MLPKPPNHNHGGAPSHLQPHRPPSTATRSLSMYAMRPLKSVQSLVCVLGVIIAIQCCILYRVTIFNSANYYLMESGGSHGNSGSDGYLASFFLPVLDGVASGASSNVSVAMNNYGNGSISGNAINMGSGITSKIASPNNKGSGFLNPIQIENSLPGSPEWILTNPARSREIEGFMSRTSVQKGKDILLFYSVNPIANDGNEGSDRNETIAKFVNFDATAKMEDLVNKTISDVKIEVFRTGWYNGIGARKVFGPITLPGINQPMPSPGRDGLIVCRWNNPYTIHTENTWATGVYLVKMSTIAPFPVKESYAIFVLRDDHFVDNFNGTINNDDFSNPDVLFQLPVNTYQAYNIWGGKNLYRCIDSRTCSQSRKVSFHRPYAAPSHPNGVFGLGAAEYLSNVQPLDYPIGSFASWNYNMVRWLERRGVNVGYVTNVDVHIRLKHLKRAKLLLTQGHDEYWTWQMRDHVTEWRDAGVNLAFLGSNTAYWQIRYEDIDANPYQVPQNDFNQSSLDRMGAEDAEEPRTIVCFRREKADPDKSKYRSVKFRQVRPEALMVGVEYIFPLGDPFDEDLIIANQSHWIFHGTGVKNGDKIPGMLGYEVDRIRSAAFQPMEGNTEEPITNMVKLFETPLVNRKNEPIVSHGGIYQAKSGAHVLGAGTMQWSWGLDDYGVQFGLRESRLSRAVEQMTKNFLEACGVVIEESSGDINNEIQIMAGR